MKVAFIGTMFSGKTTAADYLVVTNNYVKLAFADPVKMVAAQMLNQMNAYLRLRGMIHSFDPDWTYETIQRRKGEPQVRKLLQLVGTELGRELLGYEDVWVDLLLEEAKHFTRVAVDDCRFPNEANALREAGFLIVRVERPEEDRLRMLKSKYPDSWQSIMQHPSETSLDNFHEDVILYAETVEDLYHRLEALIAIGVLVEPSTERLESPRSVEQPT